MISKAETNKVKSAAQGVALSAFAVIVALGAGCDRIEQDRYEAAIQLSRTEALDVCSSLAYGGSDTDAVLCSRGALWAKKYAALTIPKETTTHKRGNDLLTGVELRSLEIYRVELGPLCVGVVGTAEFAGVKDAFAVCMAGALDFYSRVASHVCGVDISKLTGAETEFCVLKTEPAPRVPNPYAFPACRVPARNCP